MQIKQNRSKPVKQRGGRVEISHQSQTGSEHNDNTTTDYLAPVDLTKACWWSKECTTAKSTSNVNNKHQSDEQPPQQVQPAMTLNECSLLVLQYKMHTQTLEGLRTRRWHHHLASKCCTNGHSCSLQARYKHKVAPLWPDIVLYMGMASMRNRQTKTQGGWTTCTQHTPMGAQPTTWCAQLLTGTPGCALLQTILHTQPSLGQVLW